MPGLFVDLLPPEYQHLWGAIAAGLALVGLLLWAAGVKVGRVLSALTMGAAGGAVGAWVSIAATDFSPWTGGITGLAVGLLLGALAYRLLLPLALTLAVTTLYLRWHVTLDAAASQPVPATVEAADLQISIHSSTTPASEPASRPATLPTALFDLSHAVHRQWNTLPGPTQTRLSILALATFVAGLLFSLLMFRRTAMVITAILGSLILFLGIHSVLNVYARTAAAFIPDNPLVRYAIIGGLTVVGVLIQHRYFTPYTPPPRPPKEPAPTPPPAA
jgi:hypothetical protein